MEDGDLKDAASKRACKGFVIDRPRPNAQDSCIQILVHLNSRISLSTIVFVCVLQ
jgi:hypothetical protein